MNIKAISIYVGKALTISALFMFISVIVSICYGLDQGFTPLLISAIITFMVGVFPMIFVKATPAISVRDGYLIIVLSWLLSYIFGMLPYLLYGGEFTIVNAWYESVSGYTTTGSTILTDIEALPKSLLFWRSSTHFIGGLGVIILLLLIIPDTSSFKYRLSSLEISSISKEGYRFKSGKVANVMLIVYLGLAISETLLLMLAGMPFYDAINHAFSTVATGGFSVKNTSIMHYDSVWIDLVIMLYMTLAATHLGVIYMIFAKRTFRPLMRDVPRYYMTVILVLTVCVILTLWSEGRYESFGETLRKSAFQVISFLSTTGFANEDNTTWPILANLFLLFAAFHCGCSGSTTGGVKADRMLITLKAISNELKRRLSPSAVSPVRVDGASIRNETISAVMLYIVTYVFVLLISFVLVLFTGVEVAEAFSGTLSSLGNTGPALGSLGTMGNFAAQPTAAKLIYTLDMFFGRVEIFPILAVLALHSKK